MTSAFDDSGAVIGTQEFDFDAVARDPDGQELVNLSGFRGYEDEGDLMRCTVQTLFKKTKKPPSLDGG